MGEVRSSAEVLFDELTVGDCILRKLKSVALGAHVSHHFLVRAQVVALVVVDDPLIVFVFGSGKVAGGA